MKRPGDPPHPSAQPLPKHPKTVTFNLPTPSPPESSPRGAPPSLGRSPAGMSAMSASSLPPSEAGGGRKPLLRAGSSSSAASNTVSPGGGGGRGRFTFDFVDDASLSASLSSSSRRGYGRSHSYASPTGVAKLSPSRLDARYSSRLPPSYRGGSPHHYHRSYTSPIGGSHGEIKRNLFGSDGSLHGGSATGSMAGSAAMDESSDFGTDDASMAYSSAHTPPFATPSPRNSRSSPANRSNLSVDTGGTAASARSAATFLSSSPRRQGAVTGVASPLAGDLGKESVRASVASVSPARSVGSLHNLAAEHQARGAGDRFVPSRSRSNFHFELAAGTGDVTHINRGAGNGSGSRRANGSAHGGSSAEDVDLPAAPSFGATLMGGAAVVDETPGAPTADPSPDVAATFSDDDPAADADARRHDATNRQPLLYDALLRSEMLGENVDPASRSVQNSAGLASNGPNANNTNAPVVAPFHERSNNLRFSQSNYHSSRELFAETVFGAPELRDTARSQIVNSFGLNPVRTGPGRRNVLGTYTERHRRKIAKVPAKVLDAPALQDDFYLNLVDWSALNVLAVGLGSCVYLWSAATSRVTQLCDLSSTEDAVTSVAWSEGGTHLAVGSTRGDVQLWDAPAQKLLRTFSGHSARVGALSWKLSGAGGSNASLLASGSRDRLIHLRDPRSDRPYDLRLTAHKQEVCGLRWSFDERSMLASGGNDNKLLVWDIKKHTQPYHTFGDHTAAVKAIAWSPHQHGLLASGGGTADRCIRFWNCLTGHAVNCVDTGSQVCNLAFSKNCNELVSTHGYSLNQIVVWKYPSMQKIATLTGHTYRVLYLALSPDGSTIVTGAGDETLRFWQVFPGPQKENKAGGLLFPSGMPGSVVR
ncbi:hypothetical protein ACHAXT_000255 [Thalassiosira profunda]